MEYSPINYFKRAHFKPAEAAALIQGRQKEVMPGPISNVCSWNFTSVVFIVALFLSLPVDGGIQNMCSSH